MDSRNGGRPRYGGPGAAFGPEDTDWFYGREALTADLVQRIRDHVRSGRRVVAVVGASGSGKSSLLRAGLTPLVLSGAVSESGDQPWTVTTLTPGDRPGDASTRRRRCPATVAT